MIEAKKQKSPPNKREERKFSKQQLLGADSLSDRRDILSVLLSDGATYTAAEAKNMIEGFMKGQVN